MTGGRQLWHARTFFEQVVGDYRSLAPCPDCLARAIDVRVRQHW
jgi:hypothetical protein